MTPQSAEELTAEIVALLPRLRRFACALTGHPSDADDIAQIAVERALTRLNQFQPGTRLDAWLFGIVRNAFIDDVRARRRRFRLFAPAEQAERIGSDGAGAMDARLELQATWRAMAVLPAEQREAVAMVCIEGLGYREASEALGVPIGTLTSRLARGREALQRLLGDGP